MRYPIVIHKDPDSDYGVTVPDLAGCFSTGGSVDEALSQAQEAIEGHIEALMLDGKAISTPKSIQHHQQNPDYVDGIWALVLVDITKLSGKARRINITLPERILRLVDNYASQHGKSRSKFIAEAAMEYIGSAR